MNELVSVITPTYNSEQFISETVESILGQSYPHLELILIDDASSDKTREVIEIYKKKVDSIKIGMYCLSEQGRFNKNGYTGRIL